MVQAGFIGTEATFVTDLTPVAEVTFLIAICLGVVAQTRGRYWLHDRIQTPAAVLNLLLILFVMVTSFLEQRVIDTLSRRPGDAYHLAVVAHGALDPVAEGSAIYCLLAGQVRTAALRILAAGSIGDVGEQVAVLNQSGRLLLHGADGNGDGNIAPAEGGIFTA